MSKTEFNRPVIAVSSCLLGDKVRYDGGHKRSHFVESTLARHMDFVKVCPETAIGLPIPRPPIHLVKDDSGQISLRQVDDHSIDLSAPMRDFALQQVHELQGRICGYVLKSKSPSCGMERVKQFTPNGNPAEAKGVGLYTAVLDELLPQLPLEEEGRLNDARLRENFVTRVYVYQRWQQIQREGLDAAGLLQFHTRHKLLLLAHNQAGYRRLGKMLADLKAEPVDSLASRYFAEMMAVLAKPARNGNHANVLQHLQGYLKNHLHSDDKQELVQAIDGFRHGINPLLVPLTLLQHHFRRFPDDYVLQQHYLNPYPNELMLRNPL